MVKRVQQVGVDNVGNKLYCATLTTGESGPPFAVPPAPYMFEPGDMGEFLPGQVGWDANGTPLIVTVCINPPTYTGGFQVDGTPTLATTDRGPERSNGSIP
jgi:hypothetical protein